MSTLPEIYVREELWDDLLAYVQGSKTEGALERYADRLVKRFPDEIIVIYEKVITDILAPRVGRKHYGYLCRFLRRMQKLSDKSRVQRLVAQLSTKYYNRPALLEELRRV